MAMKSHFSGFNVLFEASGFPGVRIRGTIFSQNLVASNF